jgi:hypothetical protein
MTDQHHRTSANQPADELDTLTRACVHIDVAAQQLETAAHGDAFSPLWVPAGQLTLIRGGINPAIRAAADPNDHLEFIAHVDHALTLLDNVPASEGPPDLLVWTLRLHNLRDELQAARAQHP